MAEGLMNVLHPMLSGEFDMKKLLEFDPPETWRPKQKGQSISGYCWKVRDEVNRGGYSYKILYLLSSESKLWKLSCAPVTLSKQREKLSVGVGSLITCTYGGTGETDEGRTYKKYKLEVIG